MQQLSRKKQKTVLVKKAFEIISKTKTSKKIYKINPFTFIFKCLEIK